jgi:hypothetical protein
MARLAALAHAGAEPHGADVAEDHRMPGTLARTFMLAGNATFTVESKRTGKRLTFKLRRPDDKRSGWVDSRGRHWPTTRKAIWVSVLTGPNNDSDYVYLGTMWEDAEKITYDVGRKSRIAADAPSQQAAMWLAKMLNGPVEALEAQANVYHAGRCGRCGRTLTVPSSIESGLGPECAGKVGA